MICCSANPRSRQRRFCRCFSPIHHTASGSHAPLELSVSFRIPILVPIHELDKSHFIGALPAEFRCCSRRAPITCASRSEHDLNLAILYAVQSAFAIQLRSISFAFFCLTCAASLLKRYFFEALC